MITGAASGIGEKTAYLFADEMCMGGGNKGCIILCGRRKEKLNNIAEMIHSKTKTACLTLYCDITDEKQIISAVEKSILEFGRIDILVNNAGTVEKSEDITTHSAAQWDKVMNTNLKGMYLMSREVAKHMKQQKYGKVINIASVAGMKGIANQVSYVSSKSGVIGLTKAMAVELGKYNITVNAIAPGYILTDLTNEESNGYRYFKSRTVSNRIGRPEDLFGALLLLASDASEYMNGTIITVDGGISANL